MNRGRVVVYARAGSDKVLTELSGSVPMVVRVLVVVVATLAIVSVIGSTVSDIAKHGAGYVVVLVLTVLLGVGVTFRVVRAAPKRARTVAGCRWVSRGATFLGPYDDRTGLVGSASFAASNRSEAFTPPIVRLGRYLARRVKSRRSSGGGMDTTGPSAPSTSVSRGPRLGRFSRPPVLLVLIDDELVIAPTKRRNESLPVPLAAIAEVGVTMSRRAGGVTIRLDDGRSAGFLTFPDPELVVQLAQLGFTVENA